MREKVDVATRCTNYFQFLSAHHFKMIHPVLALVQDGPSSKFMSVTRGGSLVRDEATLVEVASILFASPQQSRKAAVFCFHEHSFAITKVRTEVGYLL